MAWGSNPFTSYSTMPYGQSNTWAGGQGSPWGQQNGAWNQDALTFNSPSGGYSGMPSSTMPQEPPQQMPYGMSPGGGNMMWQGSNGQSGGGMPPWMTQGGMPPWMQGYGMGGNSNPYMGGMGPNGYQMFPGMNFGQQPNGNPAARGNNTLGVFGNQGANPGQLKPLQISGPSLGPSNNYGQPTQLQTMQPGATPTPGQTAFSTQELQSGQFAAPTTDSRLPSITAGMLGMGGQAPDPNMFWNQTRNRWEY